jgi:hypothetical protein
VDNLQTHPSPTKPKQVSMLEKEITQPRNLGRMEEIRRLAEQFDQELLLLNESSEDILPILATASDHTFSVNSFESAVAESEREQLHDTVADLAARNEELEDRVLHQNFIIDMLKALNEKLFERVGSEDEILNLEIEKLNDILLSYNQNSSEIEGIDIAHTKAVSQFGRSKSNLKLTVQLGEMQIMESKLRGSIAALTAKLEGYQRSKLELERERNEERLKRIEAESQRRAYAKAYADAIAHLKKIATSAQGSFAEKLL